MEKNLSLTTMPTNEREYHLLHDEIIQYGNMAMTCFVEFSKRLKEMRDGKFYLAAGINSFDEYVEQQVGIKQRQAYNYITVYENYSEEFLQSNAKIGVTKLALLAPLAEYEREQLLENVDVENTSVAELKKALAEKDKEIAELQEDYDELKRIDNEEWQELKEERDEIDKELQQHQEENRKLADTIEKQKTLLDEKSRISEELKKAHAELDELRNASPKVETVVETVEVENPDTAKALEEANKRIEQLEAIQQSLNKQLELATDDTMSKFKSKFEDFQLIGQDILTLLSAMDETKATKCKSALKAVVGGWNL